MAEAKSEIFSPEYICGSRRVAWNEVITAFPILTVISSSVKSSCLISPIYFTITEYSPAFFPVGTAEVQVTPPFML